MQTYIILPFYCSPRRNTENVSALLSFPHSMPSGWSVSWSGSVSCWMVERLQLKYYRASHSVILHEWLIDWICPWIRATNLMQLWLSLDCRLCDGVCDYSKERADILSFSGSSACQDIWETSDQTVDTGRYVGKHIYAQLLIVLNEDLKRSDWFNKCNLRRKRL